MTHTRKSFLFATWEGGGNVPPVLAVTRKLRAAGHDVRIMSDAVNRPEAEAAGAQFVPWTLAPSRRDKSAASDIIRDWDTATPQDGLARVIEHVMCGPALLYARDVLNELARRPADAVVSSDLIMGPLAAAEAARVPLALLCANVSLFPLPGVPPLGPGLVPAQTAEDHAMHAEIAGCNEALFDHGLPALNAARQALGLAPLAHVYDQTLAARKVLLATAVAFDFAPPSLPAHVAYVGPQLGDPSADEPWVSPWPQNDTRQLILVSFSTTFQNQGAALQTVLHAARDLPARVLVTAGPALAGQKFETGANTHVCGRAPHAAVMREASVVVTHGGHGTVIRALANDCALLVLPMGRDQNDNGARVAARGAGLVVPPSAPVETISAALGRLLMERPFADRAGALGAAIRAEADHSSILDHLEALCERPRRADCAA